MKLTLKQEYFEYDIYDPITGRIINVFMIDPNQFEYYYNLGFKLIFNIQKQEEE